MRTWSLVAAVLLIACNEHGKTPCPTAGCSEAGVPDAQAGACAPSGGCTTGPMCGGQCCGQGERCVGGTCTCGTVMACTGGNVCMAGGPAGGDACGTLCCGNTTPCPIAVSAPDR
ncbi:MAG: hypothetical protein JNL83_24285 [Myxococcales bacterium]|nr:hypothetical protein [Myxococcales bacterium]